MKLAVLGDPVAHSLSPILHTAALRAAGICGSYEARRVDESGMAKAAAELRSGELDGANITMPHKDLAARLADRLAGDAARTGAVNTWVRIGGEIVGHNTDVAGIRLAWKWGGLPEDGPVLVIGAGGAAAAALVALEGRVLRIAARRPEAAAELVAAVGVDADVVPWAAPARDAVLVNATPVGMVGEELPGGFFEGAAGLFDMAYGEVPTPAVERAHRGGLPAADGPMMLLGQASGSFRLWTGRDAQLGIVRAALEDEIARRTAMVS